MSKALLLVSLAVVLGGFSPVWGQGTDTEPNNTCATAQVFGAVTLPFTVVGSLNTPPNPPDVDFFKFTAPPNSVMVVAYEGQSTGKGTLADPFLGLYNSQCQQIAVNDDGGVPLNSRLGFTVPADGVFILAASSCCDDFTGTGGSAGSYQLTVSGAGVISGKIVDGLGNALFPNFVRAFSPAGNLVAFADIACCDNNLSTY